MTDERIEITFLGTGTSHGVPMIGCDCEVCRSDDPRDKRNRTSVAVRTPDGRVILIDAAPELRLAAVACGLERVDAILFTHAHADHILGLDDVRRFNDLAGATIPCYGSAETIESIRRVFSYAEVEYDQAQTHRPSLRFQPLAPGPREICGLEVTPVPLLHGREPILGFRIGRFAYCTDCSEIPPDSWGMLEGLDLLVLGALRPWPHPTHFSLSEALGTVYRLSPRRALLTHITHHLAHAKVSESLPGGVQLAFDGQSVLARK